MHFNDGHKPSAPHGKENDWKDGYSTGFETAKAMFAPERWAEAHRNHLRLEWLGQQAGMTVQTSLDVPAKVFLVDVFGRTKGEGASLPLACDDAMQKEEALRASVDGPSGTP